MPRGGPARIALKSPMIEGIRPKAVLFSVAILAAGLWAQSAIAEDCAPIIKAKEATLTAPGFRQYLVPAASTGSSERLMSISLGDTAYLALGTSNGWEKMNRVEIIAMAKEAEDDASYRDCQSLGSQSVGGVEALGYGSSWRQVRALRAQAGQDLGWSRRVCTPSGVGWNDPSLRIRQCPSARSLRGEASWQNKTHPPISCVW